jgi:hypothetical protein
MICLLAFNVCVWERNLYSKLSLNTIKKEAKEQKSIVKTT